MFLGNFTYPYKLSLQWGWMPVVERLDGKPNTYYSNKDTTVIDYFSNAQEALEAYSKHIEELR